MMNCVSFCSSISISIPTPIAATQQHLAFSSSSSLCSISRVSINPPRRRRINNNGFTCNALFGLGVPELVVIAGVAAIVFGPKKLPEVGRSIGKTVKSFQQAAKEFESELKKEPGSSGGEPSEKSIAVSEEKKQDTEVSSSKESV
ncbi:putative twin-arginine translocation protein TatB [Medicago truncatula]|uniref:Putative twin-arginine translocation protein TatB n=1 Tax=Medicago truncatula TaxID=3880 RepID=I3SVA3_MEDTR|nr:sec-independent protein translocase protein TATA, chloroplastic [Medicago truncatula]AFK44195.1 unknown [Medicago truncatula]KEH24553.1 twin arginine translocase [Medicago truncatula]RHN49405.1 putative twin-arginine translocation protein TatB [Medicago truncatula]